MPSRHFGAVAEAGSRVMAMGISGVVSAAGKGTGAISGGAFGDDGSAATSTEEMADLRAFLRAATGGGGFGASMTAGFEPIAVGATGATGAAGAAGLRSLA